MEVKIIQKGDSLIGSSYYFESTDNYRRYSIKGYFDPATNEAVWWDDVLLEEKSTRFSIANPGKKPLLSRADFNCPGGGKMMLDGKGAEKKDEEDIKGDVHLVKDVRPQFEDEWDFVIDNYTVGANDPYIIDSVASIASTDKTIIASTTETVEVKKEKDAPSPPIEIKKETAPALKNTNEVFKPTMMAKAPPIEEKFIKREKKFIKEIPVSGDYIELKFYDNAEIDGDSISLFLNGTLLKENIRLAAKPFILKLSVNDLSDTNELVMVAENLGAIPPNTSYMVAMVGDVKYDAYLASTEGSSAMIRLKKQ